MEKMTNAEITLKLANGQLTIAAAPDTISGLNLLKYLDLAECAIIGANYTDTNTAMNTAMNTHLQSSRASCTLWATKTPARRWEPSSTPPRFRRFTCTASSRSPAPRRPKENFLPKREDCTSASITPTVTHGRKNFQIGSSFSFGSLTSHAATPMERP